MKVLFVVTSHDELGNTGHKTGFWVEEFAAPYYSFKDAGFEVVVATPKGGQAPVDPNSEVPDAQTAATERYYKDEEVQKIIANTQKLSEQKADDFDAVFYPGGHGPLWDLANDKDSQKLILDFYNSEKPVGAVCHAPGVFKNVTFENGEPFVKGKNVTGFSNTEEAAVQLTDVVPFLVEDELQKLGGHYTKTDDWGVHVVEDGLLITGQNPASSEAVAEKLIALLKK
ncbi:type 1 glutamine amidotransferase domain-containing protein [Chryseobacterium sp. Ch-15]|uniref:Type 1 glutamine amidotransferase domain-containing protein n=1 Tax=Chryseobacterium muglaense TaxID=2893752 RepID=A0A9Q3V0B6_9FLAO|nr:type 1 glutamine amidotransferase domain-containing protein [Chryseobacterium muglaense]MBD3906231.1 type 1 glutamine amidotransferase domain-containing protein [Chryseobacterium muglaense]MCC9036796.1 type 1 glutamine amidotransferase domain-containing protein [Chryseobacterium muglaense]MCM2555977.1 type 1 glutamine amidotransferase domain-containing protein [Chryseobacterium muglaense]